MDLGLAGKRALVMASSQWLGLGIGEVLAAGGVNVLFTGRTEQLLESNTASINARNARSGRVQEFGAVAAFLASVPATTSQEA